MNEPDIHEALRACFDPELGLDVEEAGLVRAVALSIDHNAPGAGIVGVPVRYLVTLEMLRPEGVAVEDRTAMLEAQIRNRLAGLEQVSGVHLSWHVGWSTARIRGEARLAPDDAVHDVSWSTARIRGEARLKLGLKLNAGSPLFPILNRGIK